MQVPPMQAQLKEERNRMKREVHHGELPTACLFLHSSNVQSICDTKAECRWTSINTNLSSENYHKDDLLGRKYEREWGNFLVFISMFINFLLHPP